MRTAPRSPAATADPAATGTLRRHYTGRGVLADARALQHERYGGAKLGSAFFGWLVAVGLTVLLGVLDGRRDRGGRRRPRHRHASSPSPCCSSPTTRAGTSPAGWPASTAPATASCRGWSACVATIVLTVIAAFVGAQYDVLSRVSLPTLPTSFADVTVAGLILAAVAVLGTLLAAVLGGKAGESFHRRVDRAAADAL